MTAEWSFVVRRETHPCCVGGYLFLDGTIFVLMLHGTWTTDKDLQQQQADALPPSSSYDTCSPKTFHTTALKTLPGRQSWNNSREVTIPVQLLSPPNEPRLGTYLGHGALLAAWLMRDFDDVVGVDLPGRAAQLH